VISEKDNGTYVQIIKDLIALKDPNHRVVQKILQKNPLKNRKIARKSQVLFAYKSGIIHLKKDEERKFLGLIQMKKTRTLSGVTPVTALTKPYPCPGRCIFCPTEDKMPKSYLASEPGAQRAVSNKFDPYLQVRSRLSAYRSIGHPIDKIELIILGGTWSAYPRKYQVWFITRCFDAMNHSQIKEKNVASWNDLKKAQKKNETAKSRCVGLVVETRPDCVTPDEVEHIRKLGGTKIQMGVQSLSNKILRLNKRGHTINDTAKAISLFRKAGFKIHLHWMANLYGSTPKKDVADFKKLFSDPRFRPDELKIYPCSLIESAELMHYYYKGLWKPYTEEELLSVLVEVFKATPRYCRLTRVIRDIPSPEIVVGNKKTNFRQIVDKELERRGNKVYEVRSREIRGEDIKPHRLNLRSSYYKTAGTKEYFVEYVTSEDKICAFLRLSMPSGNTAMIREIHVYGQSMGFGKKRLGSSQHVGLGQKLIREAKRRSKKAGYKKLKVISAIGTRNYYRKYGFIDTGLYQECDLVD